MLITVIILAVLVGISLVYNIILHFKFRQLRREMAILERITAPIVELIENHKRKMEEMGVKPGQSILHS